MLKIRTRVRLVDMLGIDIVGAKAAILEDRKTWRVSFGSFVLCHTLRRNKSLIIEEDLPVVFMAAATPLGNYGAVILKTNSESRVGSLLRNVLLNHCRIYGSSVYQPRLGCISLSPHRSHCDWEESSQCTIMA